MILAIQGTRKFEDYNIFLFAMRVILSDISNDDKEIIVYSAGPAGLNSMAQGFCNISEDSLKTRGIKIKFNKISPTWVSENLDKIDNIAFFRVPGEAKTQMVSNAEAVDKDVRIFQY